MKNTFYQQITQALSKQLDDQLFEHCVANLLEKDFPGISPIMGGSDSGMDGGVFDGEGTPYPLVTTTSDDCTGNLRRNLSEYVKTGGKRRKVIFATSRDLTAKRRKNLRKVTDELGFELVQDYEQTKIADLLYRDPTWCKELLGLIGTPEALTTVPNGARRLLGERVIGQGALIEAIENTEKDLVVVGPPGSGKTYGMYSIARKEIGFFVESSDLAEIANGVRKHQPSLLFVDDAINKRDLVQALRRLKTELTADYKIVAVGWTSHKDQLCSDLDVDSSTVLEVERLTRDEIVEVIHEVGIHGPNRLVNEIVVQSDGLPGLAVALCAAALNGNVEGVATADSMTEFLVNHLSLAVDTKAREVLSVIGLSGESGAKLNQIAAALQISPVETQRIVIGLAMGGVVHERFGDRLVVRPVRLRGALIRDVFFAGAYSLDLNSVLPHLDSQAVVNELICAKFLGAEVSDAILREHLSRYRRPMFASHQHQDSWNLYAHLGPHESAILLEQLDDDVGSHVDVLLSHQPQETIRRLLNTAVGDERALHSHPEQPIRKLQDWVKEAKPNSAEVIARRKTLIHAAIRWHDDGGPQLEYLKAIEAAFSPACEWQENKPGSGYSITIYTSCLRKEQVKELFSEWGSVVQSLNNAPTIQWKPMLSLLHIWVYPQIINCKIDDEVYGQIREGAKTMIQDLSRLSKNNPGVQQRLRSFSKDVELEIEIPYNKHFETLFPDAEVLRSREFQKQCFEAAQSLVDEYENFAAADIASKLAFWESEADVAEIKGSAFISTFCQCLAFKVANPLDVANALLSESVSANVLSPFAVLVLERKPANWQSFFRQLFEIEAYRIIATLIVIQDGENQELMPLAFENAPKAMLAIETSVLRGEVSNGTVGELLRHDDPHLAFEVAEALWHSDPSGEVPSELREGWKAAIVGSYACDRTPLGLDQIFDSNPELTYEWTCNFLNDASRNSYLSDERAGEMCTRLTKPQRSSLITQLTRDGAGSRILDKIVGHDVELYAQLLAKKELEKFHTQPLENFAPATWPNMANLALKSGISPKDVARSTFGRAFGWTGDESKVHQSRIDQLSKVDTGGDSGLTEVVSMLIDMEESARTECLKRERHAAVYGER